MIAGPYTYRIVIGSTRPAVTITCYGASGPINFTGYDFVHAEIRHVSGEVVIKDLNPSFTDPINGEITIPAITDENTAALAAYEGTHFWDIITSNGGAVSEPILAGPAPIVTKITDSD